MEKDFKEKRVANLEEFGRHIVDHAKGVARKLHPHARHGRVYLALPFHVTFSGDGGTCTVCDVECFTDPDAGTVCVTVCHTTSC